MKHALGQLEQIAHRARQLLLLGEGMFVVGVMLCAGIVCATLDWWLRFPSLVRTGFLVAILLAATHLVRRRVLPAIRFRPTVLDVAFRIERRNPHLQGRLASAVDFSQQSPSLATSVESSTRDQLTQQVIDDVDLSTEATELHKALRFGPTCKHATWLVIGITLLSLVGALSGNLLRVGATRVLMPWSDTRWPARTEVRALLADESVHAKGVPLALRAELSRGDNEDERVWASYRVKDTAATTWSSWTEVLLARQPDGVYERLLEVSTDAVELRFLSHDNESELVHLAFVPAPSIVSAAFEALPPNYLETHGVVVETFTQSLGDGTNDSAFVEQPVLEGSLIRVRAQLNVPAEVSIAGTEGFDGTVFIDDADPTMVLIEGVARGAAKIQVRLHTHFGLTNRNDIGFAFETLPDRPPTAAIIEPPNDESFVVDAVFPLKGELQDDLGLAQTGFEFTARASNVADERVLRTELKPATGVLVDESQQLSLASLGVSAGETVLVRAVAEDIYVQDGVRHPRVLSAPRTLRIVSEEDFEQQLRSTLASVRREVVRTDALQARAQESLVGKIQTDQRDQSVAKEQAEVSESLVRHAESLATLGRRMQRNGREGNELSQIALEAKAVSEAARAASEEAAQHIESSQAPGASPEGVAKAEQDAKGAQEEVRANLEALVELLDRDADSWLARRRLEELRERIEKLATDTSALASRTQAKARDELSAEDRAALDALATQQRDAATDADSLLNELRERQEATKKIDPALARALERAAQAAQKGRVREEMEQAAEDTEDNRLTQAGEAEQRAMNALAQAEQALKDAGKLRAEELARVLESLIASVERFIGQTEVVIPKLLEVAAAETNARSVGVISQNSRGLAGEARTAGRAASRVAAPLERAAESLSASASLLRKEQPNLTDASAAAESALVSFKEALALAEAAKERAQAEAAAEKREELLAKYRELLEREVAIRMQTERSVPVDKNAPTRREQVELRRLGVAQTEVRTAVAGILTDEETVAKSAAFSDMHHEIDERLASAVDALSKARAIDALLAQTEGAQGIADIIAALGKDEEEDPFAEQKTPQEPASSGSGAGGGGQPSETIPPLAELKLIRRMQQSIFDRTLQLDASRANGVSIEEIEKRREDIVARQARILELAEKIAERMQESKGKATAEQPTERPVPVPVPPQGGAK